MVLGVTPLTSQVAEIVDAEKSFTKQSITPLFFDASLLRAHKRDCFLSKELQPLLSSGQYCGTSVERLEFNPGLFLHRRCYALEASKERSVPSFETALSPLLSSKSGLRIRRL